ncbi:MAG: prolyl oligopeptidase family serine peptidase [Myxococcota bacterium]
MKEIQPCGGWDSEIGSADLVRGALVLSAPRIEEGRLYWLERRPAEGGRQVVVSGRLEEASSEGIVDLREESPREVNVRTRVHEYGGGEYTTRGGRLFYVDDANGRIFVCREGGGARALTPAGSCYADLLVSPAGDWLVAVEERPVEGGEAENRLVAIPLGTAGGETQAAGPPRVLASGHDFYASPVFSPGGDELAFIAWDHPNMPWNGTVLETLSWSTTGVSGQVRHRAGGVSESLFQPRYAPDGVLYVMTDRSGYWNLARLGGGGLEAVHQANAECGRAQWVFGMSSWTFLSDRRVLASATEAGVDQLVELNVESGASSAWPADFASVGGLQADGGWVAWIGGTARTPSALYVCRAEVEGKARAPICVRQSATLELSDAALSVASPRVFASANGRTTHAFVYPPCSESYAGRAGERPPLLVKSHGGPTSATSSALDPRIQFWTSRGFAVADVNYGGSTGYGRAYRDVLERAWGVVDVEDCVHVAQSLAAAGEVDGERLAISGGSAGGFTTLCALTFHDTFAAGASHYGIGDLEALARDTHKFESRYTDWLVGALPEDLALYHARSPIHHHERLACPVIFFQGLEDKVVPPNQAEAMVAVLKERGIAHAYVPFAGEQHGFRRAENIRTALDGELYFYSQVFGFSAPRPEGVRVVEGQS